jgi:hypothetical protein
MGLRLDSSTASVVSFERPRGLERPGLATSAGLIGDRPGAYNASFRLGAAMPERQIVNVNIAESG